MYAAWLPVVTENSLTPKNVMLLYNYELKRYHQRLAALSKVAKGRLSNPGVESKDLAGACV